MYNKQPIKDVVWPNGVASYNTYKLYTLDLAIKEWDKVVIDWTTFIVKGTQLRWGIMAQYSKCVIDESKWS